MASFERTVFRNLQCPICLDLLSDPKQLSCTHTFCKKCLCDILECSLQNQANSIKCPICRSITNVREGNVENLNTIARLKSLVDDVRNSKQLCEMCDMQSRAVQFCCACSKYICNECLELHNNHEVLRVEDIREGKVDLEKRVYCQELVHKSDGLKEVCSDVCIKPCKKLICTRCRTLYHTKELGHTVQDRGEYNDSFRKKIESLQVRGKTKAETVKNHMTCVDDQLQRVTDHTNREKARISRECEEAINKLKERKANINQQIDAQGERLCQRLKQMKVEDEILAASIESASVLAGHSLEAPLAGDTIVIRDSLCGELKNILGRNDPEKKLATDIADRAEQLKFTLGNNEWPRIGRQTFIFGFLSVFFLVLSLVVFNVFMSLPTKSVKNDLRCGVDFPEKNSMTVTPDGMTAVSYWTGGITFYSADGQLQHTVLKDVGISDVGFFSDGRCVVINTENTITLYTSTWEQLDVRFESLSHGEGGLSSVTVHIDDQIYVSYRKAKKIQVFSPAGGKAIREIPCDGYVPLSITSFNDTRRDSLLVSGCARRLIMIDKNGSIEEEFDPLSRFSEQIYAPMIRIGWSLLSPSEMKKGC